MAIARPVPTSMSSLAENSCAIPPDRIVCGGQRQPVRAERAAQQQAEQLGDDDRRRASQLEGLEQAGPDDPADPAAAEARVDQQQHPEEDGTAREPPPGEYPQATRYSPATARTGSAILIAVRTTTVIASAVSGAGRAQRVGVGRCRHGRIAGSGRLVPAFGRPGLLLACVGLLRRVGLRLLPLSRRGTRRSSRGAARGTGDHRTTLITAASSRNVSPNVSNPRVP